VSDSGSTPDGTTIKKTNRIKIMPDAEPKRILRIQAKVSDRCNTQIEHLDIDVDGYPLDIAGVCDGDYIDIKIDLDTGKVIDFESLTDEEITDLVISDD
jgi:hypothetical protein